MTIFRPATFIIIGCGFSECWAPRRPRARRGEQHHGQLDLPPDMYGSLRAWLATWSMAT
jgi:hypothetical protein